MILKYVWTAIKSEKRQDDNTENRNKNKEESKDMLYQTEVTV